jgi:hypothetical protein
MTNYIFRDSLNSQPVLRAKLDEASTLGSILRSFARPGSTDDTEAHPNM